MDFDGFTWISTDLHKVKLIFVNLGLLYMDLQGFARLFDGFGLMFMDLHGLFAWIWVDFIRFVWILIILHGFESILLI